MIQFFGTTAPIKSKKRKLRILVHQILADHQKTLASLNYIFTNDDELLQINISSLNHDYYTDIITFDYSIQSQIEGEIYISLDRVKDNAANFSQKFHVELIRVMVHGVLHLVGYKDKTKKQKSIMREKEDLYINKYLNTFHVEQ